MNMSSFVDEYTKIAASSKAAKNPKSRIGRRPIRAHNLLKKADAKMEAVQSAAGGLKGLLKRLGGGLKQHKAPIGLLAAGGVGAKAGEEYLVEPWQYGRRAQEMGAQF